MKRRTAFQRRLGLSGRQPASSRAQSGSIQSLRSFISPGSMIVALNIVTDLLQCKNSQVVSLSIFSDTLQRDHGLHRRCHLGIWRWATVSIALGKAKKK